MSPCRTASVLPQSISAGCAAWRGDKQILSAAPLHRFIMVCQARWQRTRTTARRRFLPCWRAPAAFRCPSAIAGFEFVREIMARNGATDQHHFAFRKSPACRWPPPGRTAGQADACRCRRWRTGTSKAVAFTTISPDQGLVPDLTLLTCTGCTGSFHKTGHWCSLHRTTAAATVGRVGYYSLHAPLLTILTPRGTHAPSGRNHRRTNAV